MIEDLGEIELNSCSLTLFLTSFSSAFLFNNIESHWVLLKRFLIQTRSDHSVISIFIPFSASLQESTVLPTVAAVLILRKNTFERVQYQPNHSLSSRLQAFFCVGKRTGCCQVVMMNVFENSTRMANVSLKNYFEFSTCSSGRTNEFYKTCKKNYKDKEGVHRNLLRKETC